MNVTSRSPLTILRSIAAVLVLFAFVLPISKCTRDDSAHTVEYHYIIGDALDRAPDQDWRYAAADLALAFAAFCWPLAATSLAQRTQRPRLTLIRLIVEPIALAASAWWLGVIVTFRSPAVGYYVVAAGLGLYGIVWFSECMRKLHMLWSRASLARSTEGDRHA